MIRRVGGHGAVWAATGLGETPLHAGFTERFTDGGARRSARLIERHRAQCGVEGFGLEGPVAADPDERAQELPDGDHTGGGGQLAVVVHILVERQASGRVVQINRQHILTA